ncbi:DUF2461 domain-containing protein [uncultured Roseobacter sp.]|uniref:DUF2461 domain-containing protein n=1 Tax=uncultured Roseobacter sp. TaxID=114847 RepID=UPI0026205B1D|nr:DUF2461 domain-containing protein [uncultured Roseobacter sp.]
MDPFDHFSPQALTFLSDLKAHNDKAWFAAHKQVYEQEIKEPAKGFALAMSAALSTTTGRAHHAKIYRIHRDIRFSKDKTPYNTHIHLSFAPEDGGPNAPMWFFGLGLEKLSLGCGVFQFDKDRLAAFRAQMAGDKGAALIALTTRLQDTGLRVNAPELKRIPSGFDKDHPHAEALRRKGFSAWKDISDTRFVTQPDLVTRTMSEMIPLREVFDFLSDIA